LGERKGIYELVEAIRSLQAAGVDAEWVLAGDGDVEAVRELSAGLPAPEKVSVPGWLGREETATLLSKASVFCLPSTDEGVPMALLEAMAYGLACVVTPVGGIPEVVVDGQNGVLVPARNADALAEGLKSVLLDAPRRIAMGDRARQTVAARYAVDGVVEAIERLYRSLGCESERGGG
jgi:glycosyltransferase involved in cell wall biosynthesis